MLTDRDVLRLALVLRQPNMVKRYRWKAGIKSQMLDDPRFVKSGVRAQTVIFTAPVDDEDEDACQNLSFPVGATSLRFQPASWQWSMLDLPSSITELVLNCYPSPQPLLALPPSLRTLVICTSEFDQPLDALPEGLTMLRIQLKSALTSSLARLPASLTDLALEAEEFCLDNLPAGLLHLHLCGNLTPPAEPFPESLLSCTIHPLWIKPDIFERFIGCLPDSLQKLTIRGHPSELPARLSWLPSSLSSFEVFDTSSFPRHWSRLTHLQGLPYPLPLLEPSSPAHLNLRSLVLPCSFVGPLAKLPDGLERLEFDELLCSISR